MRTLSFLLALIGLAVSIALVGWYGFGGVVAAVESAGWGGFAIVVAWQLALFCVLGLAWDAIIPARAHRRLWVPIWGRMVRDASANCLPFSQVGGFVFGARAVTLHGFSWPLATASTVVDVTAEFLAQLAFTGIGLGILLARAPRSGLAVPVEVGLGLAVMACFAFVWLQQGAAELFARLGRRIAGRWFDNANDRMQVLQAEFSLIYGHALRLAIGFTMHLLGWLGTGLGGWIAYHVIGVPIDFDDALAIEALLSAAAALAFLVPVNAGVQEAGYAGLGAVFGVPPELSLGVSLIRRARDLTVGIPILLLWQVLEVRRLGTRGATPPA
ncbi:MAG TPA: lysylphosphatidylglycerol synthase domain-containing protein [Acetobacteraceae bacterium]